MPVEKAPKFIKSAREAIEAVGGPVFVAELFGFKGPNAVRNWYKRKLPPESIDELGPRLRAKGYEFNAKDLFQQYPVASEPKAARKAPLRRVLTLRQKLRGGEGA